MSATNETRTGLSGEISIIPGWAWILAGILFIGAQIGFDGFLTRLAGAPPVWFLVLLGIVGGFVLGCAVLFIGYINRDSKRRGMSSILWTTIAIIIPHGLGIILYFVLRQPLRSTCPQCGTPVETGFNFCPRCNHKLSPSCPKCQHLVTVNDAYCPYCGTALGTPASTSDRATNLSR
jgi:RNA polymerase subunit RPABC4/transcription elongation factor Spt4